MRPLVQPQYTAIPVEGARVALRVERFDPRTGTAADLLLRDTDQSLVQAAFHLPVARRAFQQVPKPGLGDAVAVFLEGSWIMKVHRPEAKDALNSRRVDAHHPLVPTFHVTNLHPLVGLGAF